MLETLIFVFTFFFLAVTLYYQNNLVRLYLLAFAAYFYTGYFFAANIELHQLSLYNVCILMMTSGVWLASLIRTGRDYREEYPPACYSSEKINSPLFVLYLTVMCGIAVAAFLTLVALHGLPILNITARKEVSGFFTYLVGLLWILYPLVFLHLNGKWLIIVTGLMLLILLTMGYRTPLVSMIFMFAILNMKHKKVTIHLWLKLFGAALMLSIVAVYPLLRFQEDPEAIVKLLSNLDMPPELFIVAPLVLVFAEGASVVKGIMRLHSEMGPLWGEFTLSGFITVLPGEQEHSRTLLSYWLGRTNWQESTTTSTLIGQFYLEGGEYFSYLMCFILGFFICVGSRFYLKSNKPFINSAFLLVFIFLTLSIHTGMLDPIVIYALLIYFISYIVYGISSTIFPRIKP